MEEPKHNQSQENNQPDAGVQPDREHETHTAALALLVLATLVVITVVLSVNQEVTDLSPDNYGQQASEPINNETHGAGIPVEQVQTTDQSGTSGLPSNLPVPNNAEVLQNYQNPAGDNATQSVYLFSSPDSVTSLANTYQSYFADSDFTIDNTSQSDSSTALQASNTQNQRLIISINSKNGSSEVQINYITQ
jgi:hypothetical protein